MQRIRPETGRSIRCRSRRPSLRRRRPAGSPDFAGVSRAGSFQILSPPPRADLCARFIQGAGEGRLLIRVGADTHDFNPEQWLIPVPFTQNGTQITATLSASAELAPPGYYMLFVFNTAGVPAVAKIISIGSYLPDLIPTSLSYGSTTGVFTSVVKNQGTAASPAGVVVGVSYSVDGAYCTWGAVGGPLAAGASVNVGSDGGPCTIASGTHTITVFADDADRMVELDKTNNQLSQTITVGGGGTSLPDLVPTSLSYDSGTGLFTVVVKNQGTAATPSNVVIGNAFYVGGTYVSW